MLIEPDQEGLRTTGRSLTLSSVDMVGQQPARRRGQPPAAFGLDDTTSDDAWVALLLPEEAS